MRPLKGRGIWNWMERVIEATAATAAVKGVQTAMAVAGVVAAAAAAVAATTARLKMWLALLGGLWTGV